MRRRTQRSLTKPIPAACNSRSVGTGDRLAELELERDCFLKRLERERRPEVRRRQLRRIAELDEKMDALRPARENTLVERRLVEVEVSFAALEERRDSDVEVDVITYGVIPRCDLESESDVNAEWIERIETALYEPAHRPKIGKRPLATARYGAVSRTVH